MAVVGNIEETTASVVLDQGLWMGTDNSSTAWLSGIAGVSAGDAEGGVKMMILDVVVDTAATASSITFASTNIVGLSGTKCFAVLSVNNMAGGFEVPTAVYTSANGTVINFTPGSGTGGDTHRLCFLYA